VQSPEPGPTPERERSREIKKNYKTQSFAELGTAMTMFPLRITFAQGFIVDLWMCMRMEMAMAMGRMGMGRI